MLAVMNKNNFDWNEVYNGRGVVINCKTEEDANDLLKYLNSNNIRWASEKSLLEENNYDKYEENTCYWINMFFESNIEVLYRDIKFFKREDHKIYKWENTSSKSMDWRCVRPIKEPEEQIKITSEYLENKFEENICKNFDCGFCKYRNENYCTLSWIVDHYNITEK